MRHSRPPGPRCGWRVARSRWRSSQRRGPGGVRRAAEPGHGAGGRSSGVVAFVAGAYWFLAGRGVLRVAAAALASSRRSSCSFSTSGRGCCGSRCCRSPCSCSRASPAGAALSRGRRDGGHADATTAAPVRHPFLVMNPRSGGGKVTRFGLKEKAEAMGAEVALLDGPDIVDVAALARDAVARGADLLGVAGGDGTQALVAGIAARARPAVPGDQRGNPQPLRVGSRAGSGRPVHVPGRSDRRRRDPRRPGRDRRSHVREQRLVRGLCGDRAEPGVPRRQDAHDVEHASRPARRAQRRPAGRARSATSRSRGRRRCW